MLKIQLAVTGWKAVFVNKGFTRRIVELTKDESDVILEYLFKVSLCSVILVHFYTHPLTVIAGIPKPRQSSSLQMAQE
jgi:hypothetical protein